MSRAMLSAIMLIVTIGSGCSSPPPLKTVAAVDLPRFMGDWYVVASIPTFLEVDAYNPVESYRLDVDGSIATTFTFNAGGLDGEKKNLPPPRLCTRSSEQCGVGYAVYLADQSRLSDCLSG